VTTKHGLVTGYAQALFAIAQAEGALDDVEDELFRFARSIDANDDLRDALSDIAIPTENKKALVVDLLDGRVHPKTMMLIEVIIDAGHSREIARIIDDFARIAAESRQSSLAEVRSAVDLTEAQRDSLAKALSKATGRSIELKVVIDPAVIGGVISRIGDQVFDGSVATRLQEAKEQLES
jgi:F-type H+-transporting ATPase subunit delta